jgi:hypothetical protein
MLSKYPDRMPTIDTFDLSQVQEAVHVALTTRRSGKVLLTG